MIKRLFILFCIAAAQLGASPLEKLFHKPEKKSVDSKLGCVECIYLINLDHRTDRLERTLKKFAPYGITPCRPPAVYGPHLTLEEIKSVGVKFARGMCGSFMGAYFVQGLFGKTGTATRKDQQDSPSRFYHKTNVTKNIEKIGARFGAYSYLLTRSGIEKILEHFKQNQIFLPYDMDFYLPKEMRVYCIKDEVVKHLQHTISNNK